MIGMGNIETKQDDLIGKFVGLSTAATYTGTMRRIDDWAAHCVLQEYTDPLLLIIPPQTIVGSRVLHRGDFQYCTRRF